MPVYEQLCCPDQRIIGVEDPAQWDLNKANTFCYWSLGPSLYRYSTVISIGCPGIVWPLRTSVLLCQSWPLHTNSAAKKRRFTFLRFINLHQKGPSVKSPGYANYRVKRLMIHYNIRATLCESFCDVITRVR